MTTTVATEPVAAATTTESTEPEEVQITTAIMELDQVASTTGSMELTNIQSITGSMAPTGAVATTGSTALAREADITGSMELKVPRTGRDGHDECMTKNETNMKLELYENGNRLCGAEVISYEPGKREVRYVHQLGGPPIPVEGRPTPDTILFVAESLPNLSSNHELRDSSGQSRSIVITSINVTTSSGISCVAIAT